MNLSLYEAECLHRYQAQVVLPKAERRQNLERELALLRKESPRTPRRSPVRLLGSLLLNLGERLAGAERTGASGAS